MIKVPAIATFRSTAVRRSFDRGVDGTMKINFLDSTQNWISWRGCFATLAKGPLM